MITEAKQYIFEINKKNEILIGEVIWLALMMPQCARLTFLLDGIKTALITSGITIIIYKIKLLLSLGFKLTLFDILLVGLIVLICKILGYIFFIYNFYHRMSSQGKNFPQIESFKKILFVIGSNHPSSNLLNISGFLYSPKTQKEIFRPIVAEWQYEYFEDLKNKRFGRAKYTNIRWIYHFLLAMWMKSPIGDLIEFISKFAK